MVPIVEHELPTKPEQSSWPSCFVEFALHNLLFSVKCSCWITINFYQKQWLSFGSNWKRWKRIPEFLSLTHGNVTLNMWLTISGRMILEQTLHNRKYNWNKQTVHYYFSTDSTTLPRPSFQRVPHTCQRWEPETFVQ